MSRLRRDPSRAAPAHAGPVPARAGPLRAAPAGFTSFAARPAVYDLWLRAVFAIVIGAMVFNFALAFVNTRVMGISESHVMLVEIVLLGTGLVLAVDRRVDLYVVLALFFAYMALIMALRPELDLKALRDGLIPICFYFLGRGMRDIRSVDRLVLLCAGIVIAIGAFEYFLLDTFVSFVNINDYYVARGTISPGDNFHEDSALFISGIRPEGRNFFPFLGEHRVSSVFLEPVSTGNFGAFLAMWALFRKDMAGRWALFAAAGIVIVMADARFGMFVTLAVASVVLVYRVVPRVIWWCVPVMIALALVLYGMWTSQLSWQDNLGGRWFHAARLFLKLDLPAVFGVSSYGGFLADNGYAATLHQFGLIGVLGLWTAFIFVPVRSWDAWRFRALVVTYICLLMIVSNSLYSIKTAALLWLCVGATDVWPGFPAKGKKAAHPSPGWQPPDWHPPARAATKPPRARRQTASASRYSAS